MVASSSNMMDVENNTQALTSKTQKFLDNENQMAASRCRAPDQSYETLKEMGG